MLILTVSLLLLLSLGAWRTLKDYQHFEK